MSSILKSDIFFFITSVAVVVISIGVIIALFYVVRILRDLKELSHKAKEEGGRIIDDMKIFRESTRTSGFKLANLLALLGFVKKVRRKSSPKNTEDEI